jgi:hypothetical protein
MRPGRIELPAVIFKAEYPQGRTTGARGNVARFFMLDCGSF